MSGAAGEGDAARLMEIGTAGASGAAEAAIWPHWWSPV